MRRLSIFALVIPLLALVARAQNVFTARLTGFHEAPAVVSAGSGHAHLTISQDESSIAWEATYSGLEGGDVLFAHVHIGQPNVAGGIAAFFCGGPPAPGPTRPPCPNSGTITGTWTVVDIIGPKSQGVDPADSTSLGRAIKAIRDGFAYANVHSVRSPGGEIRGQLKRAHDHDQD
jgi:hypothetical protein